MDAGMSALPTQMAAFLVISSSTSSTRLSGRKSETTDAAVEVHLAINVQTAKALGIELPQIVVALVDEVIA
jgi:hypothetical protein